MESVRLAFAAGRTCSLSFLSLSLARARAVGAWVWFVSALKADISFFAPSPVHDPHTRRSIRHPHPHPHPPAHTTSRNACHTAPYPQLCLNQPPGNGIPGKCLAAEPRSTSLASATVHARATWPTNSNGMSSNQRRPCPRRRLHRLPRSRIPSSPDVPPGGLSRNDGPLLPVHATERSSLPPSLVLSASAQHSQPSLTSTQGMDVSSAATFQPRAPPQADCKFSSFPPSTQPRLTAQLRIRRVRVSPRCRRRVS